MDARRFKLGLHAPVHLELACTCPVTGPVCSLSLLSAISVQTDVSDVIDLETCRWRLGSRS